MEDGEEGENESLGEGELTMSGRHDDASLSSLVVTVTKMWKTRKLYQGRLIARATHRSKLDWWAGMQ